MLLTLTLPAGPDGKGLVSLILQAFRRWRRTLNVRRYLYAVEVKPHALGFYVHLHALVDCVWLNLDAARDLWQSLTGATVLDVQRVSQSGGGKRAAVREVVKYVTKAPDALTPEQVDALGRATRGRRLGRGALAVLRWLGESLLDINPAAGLGWPYTAVRYLSRVDHRSGPQPSRRAGAACALVAPAPSSHGLASLRR